jgi:hypothetical protein
MIRSMLRFAGCLRPVTNASKSRTSGGRHRLALEVLERRETPAAYVWTGAGPDQLASDALNWSPAQVPTPADTLIFSDAATAEFDPAFNSSAADLETDTGWNGQIQFDVPFTITEHMVQSGGSLAGAGGFFGPAHLEIASGAVYDWQGGTLSAAGQLTIDSGGTMNMSAASGGLVSDWDITNNGTVNWTGGNFAGLGIMFTNSGTMTASSSLTYSDPLTGALFNNGGTLNVAGTVDFQAPFWTTGSVNVSDTLQLDEGGAIGGTNDIGDGSQILLNDGLFQGLPGAQGTGNGTLVIGRNTGTPSLNVQGPMTQPRVRLQDGGTITGPGNLRITNRMDWVQGGLMSGDGVTSIAGGAELVGGLMRQQTRTLRNLGTVTLDGAAWIMNGGARFENANTVWISAPTSIDNTLGSFGSIVNTGEIMFTAQDATQITYINRIELTNNGAVRVNAGTLSFGGEGFFGAVVVVGSNGYFKTSAGAEVHFIETDVTFNGNANANSVALRGEGWYRARGGTLTVDTAMVIADNFQLDGGGDGITTLTGAGTFEAHNFLWTGGIMTGIGTTLVGYGDYMEIDTETATLSGRQFLVIGVVQWDPIAGELDLNDGAQLVVNGGMFQTNVQLGLISSNDVFPGPGGDPILVTDGGVFQANPGWPFPGIMRINVPFSEDEGVVQFYQDATFSGRFSNTGGLFRTTANAGFSAGFFQSGATAASYFGAGTYTFANPGPGARPLESEGGTVSLAGGTIQQQPAGQMQCSNTVFAVSGQIVGYWDCTRCTIRLVGDLRVTGTMALDGSKIYLGGHTLDVDLLQNNNLPNQRGEIHLQGGTLNWGAGSYNDGFLFRPGTIGGNMVEGADATVSSGDETGPGYLIVEGDFIESDGASLTFLVGSDGSDSFVVLGTAHLAGTINVLLVAGYTPDPTVPDTFSVLTYYSYQGSFDNGTIDLGNGLAFAVVVGSDTVTLVTELSA